MTVRTEVHASILAPPGPRNALPPSPFPALAGARARSHHAGSTLVGLVWMLVLAFFVFAVAVPASVMHRRVQEERVARAEP